MFALNFNGESGCFNHWHSYLQQSFEVHLICCNKLQHTRFISGAYAILIDKLGTDTVITNLPKAQFHFRESSSDFICKLIKNIKPVY